MHTKYGYQVHKLIPKFLHLLVLLLCFNFCKKNGTDEEPKLDDRYWGEASATVNGVFWKTNPYCTINEFTMGTISISFDSLIKNYFLTKKLFFSEIPPVAGTYKIIKRTFPKDGKPDAGYSFMEYDLKLGDYDILESANNVLTIESIDTITTQEIKGSFDLTFVVTKRPPPDQYPADTIRFKNGKFHGKIRRK